MKTSSKLQESTSTSNRDHEPLWMRVYGATGARHDVAIDSGECAIGSASWCGLSLAGENVRPVHCLLFRGERHSVLRRWAPDAYLNNQPFDDAVVQAGDRLQVGGIEIEFVGRKSAISADVNATDHPSLDSPDIDFNSGFDFGDVSDASTQADRFSGDTYFDFFDGADDECPNTSSRRAKPVEQSMSQVAAMSDGARHVDAAEHLRKRARGLLRVLRSEREDAKTALNQVDQMRSDLEATTKRLASLESIRSVERGEWTRKESQFANEVATLRASFEHLQTDYATAREELAESIASVETAQATITTLSDMEQASIANAYALGEQLEALRRQNEELETGHEITLAERQAECDQLRERLASLEDVAELAQVELAKSQEQAARTQEIPRLESEIARLNAAISEQQASIDRERSAWSKEREAWDDERAAWQELFDEEQRAQAERERGWDIERQRWTEVRDEWEFEKQSQSDALENERRQRANAESAWEKERRIWTDARRKLEEENQRSQSQWNADRRAWSEREEEWNEERRTWTEVRENLESERQTIQDALQVVEHARDESATAWEEERRAWTEVRRGFENERQSLLETIEESERAHAETKDAWAAQSLEKAGERDELRRKISELEVSLESAECGHRDDAACWEKERLAFKVERDAWAAERGSLTRQLNDERERLARKEMAHQQESARMQDALDGLNDNIGDLQHELSEQRKQLLDAQEMLDVSTKAGFELETEVAERRRDVEQQQKKWIAEREAWDAKLKRYENDLAAREKELADSIAVHEAHKANETKWEEERRAWSMERDGDRRDRSADAEKWNVERQELQKELEAASQASRTAFEQIASERQAWNNEHERLENERRAMESRILEIQQEAEKNESIWREAATATEDEIKSFSDAVDSLEKTNRELRKKLAQSEELLAVKSDVDAARFGDISETEAKLKENHLAAMAEQEEIESRLATQEADLSARQAEFSQIQSEWTERFRNEKAEWERRLKEIEARELQLAERESTTAAHEPADASATDSVRRGGDGSAEARESEWNEEDSLAHDAGYEDPNEFSRTAAGISDAASDDDAHEVPNELQTESRDGGASTDSWADEEADDAEFESDDVLLGNGDRATIERDEQESAGDIDDDDDGRSDESDKSDKERAAFAHLRELNIISGDLDEEAPRSDEGPATSSLQSLSYLDQCESEDAYDDADEDGRTDNIALSDQESLDGETFAGEVNELNDRRRFDRDASEDDSLNEYMDSLMRRVRGESAAQSNTSYVPKKSPSDAPLQEAALPIPGSIVDSTREEKVRLEDIKTAGTPPERQADFDAMRTLANSSARSAISMHDSSTQRQNAMSKALFAAIGLICGALIVTFAPAWLSWQSVLGFATMAAGGYWSGKTMMTVLHNMRVDAWDPSEFTPNEDSGAQADESNSAREPIDPATNNRDVSPADGESVQRDA